MFSRESNAVALAETVAEEDAVDVEVADDVLEEVADAEAVDVLEDVDVPEDVNVLVAVAAAEAVDVQEDVDVLEDVAVLDDVDVLEDVEEEVEEEVLELVAEVEVEAEEECVSPCVPPIGSSCCSKNTSKRYKGGIIGLSRTIRDQSGKGWSGPDTTLHRGPLRPGIESSRLGVCHYTVRMLSLSAYIHI